MLRPISRRLPIGSVIRSVPSLAVNRAFVVNCRRYAEKKPPSNSDPSPPPISDYIASQHPPSNPETPPDRMPHQTEEDIATEKIFGNQAPNEDGLPAEGVPVEDVFKEDPKAMRTAPEVIKSNGVEQWDGGQAPDSGNQRVEGHSGMPHVNEESIAYERIISGEASGAPESAPGMETPAVGVPIEDVVGDGEKPEVMKDESPRDDDEPPPSGQSLRNNDQQTSSTSTGEDTGFDTTDTTRKSILDLFGPASGRKPRQKASEPPVTESKDDPLLSLPLEHDNLDLSSWDEAHQLNHQNIAKENIDPEEWADLQRGKWDEVEPPHDEPIQKPPEDPARAKVRELYNRPNLPKRSPPPFDMQLPFTEPRPSSPWDFFYPPAPPPTSLESAVAQRKGTITRREKKAYDPFAAKEKEIKWPFLYNRDQLVERCTNLLMVHGKKATAERIMQDVFFRILELNPRKHPVTYLADALDRNAPLIKNSSSKAKGGGRKMIIKPVALTETQRIRAAWMSLIKGAGKGDSDAPFAQRLANEIMKVMAGQGSGIQHRLSEHKKAMANKLNVQVPKQTKMKRT